MATIDMAKARNAYHLGTGQIALSQFRSPDPCMPTTGQIAMSQLLCKPTIPHMSGMGRGVGFLIVHFTGSKAYDAIHYDLYEDGHRVASNISSGYKRVVAPKYGAETSVLGSEKYQLNAGNVLYYGTMEAHDHTRKFYWAGVVVATGHYTQTPRIGNYVYYMGAFKGTISANNYNGIKRRVYTKHIVNRAYKVYAVNAKGSVNSNIVNDHPN